MAKPSEEIKKLNAEIKELYKQLGRADMPPIFRARDLQTAKDKIVGLKAQLGEVRTELDFIGRSFRDAFAELSSRNTELAKTKSALSGISRISQQLLIESEDLVNLDEKRVDTLERQAKLKFRSLQIAIDSGKLDEKALGEAKFALAQEENLLKTITQIRKEKELIDKSSGVKVFEGLNAITQAVPGLKQMAPAFQEASKAAQEQAAYNLKNFGSTKGITKQMREANKAARAKRLEDLKALRTGKGLTVAKIKELGLEKQLTSLKTSQVVAGAAGAKMARAAGLDKQLKPIAKLGKSIGPLTAGLKALKPILSKAFAPLAIIMEIFTLDKTIADTAKQLNLTYQEATQVRAEMSGLAMASGNNLVTGQKLNETFNAINVALGTSVQTMDEDLLVQFTELREMAGMTNEQLQGIAAITLATGKELNTVTGEFMAQAKITSMQNGVLLNEKALMADIGKISAATTLSLGKNPAALGEAVASARSLGLELAKVEAISSNLLNFEQSIENELQAELLLGKNINLEKARQAALNNDLATVAEEIAKQAGSAAEFAEMNVIQQEALASAVGLNREELASSLFLQEQLKGQSEEQAKIAKEQFERRVKEIGLAAAQRELEEQGVDGLRRQASIAERLTGVVEKLNELFIALVEPLMPVLDVFISIFGVVGQIMRILRPVIDLMTFVGAGLGDLIGSGIGLITGDGADFSNVNRAGARFEQNLGYEGYYSKLSSQGQGGDLMLANGGMMSGGLLTGSTRLASNVIAGEAGGNEAIVTPLPAGGIKTDNSDVVDAIRNLTSKIEVGTIYEIA